MNRYTEGPRYEVVVEGRRVCVPLVYYEMAVRAVYRYAQPGQRWQIWYISGTTGTRSLDTEGERIRI